MPNKKTPRRQETINGKSVTRRYVRREKILSLLALGRSSYQIASQLSCSRKTIFKLLKEPDFQRELAEEREMIALDSVTQTADIVSSAISKVAAAIDDGDSKLAFDFLKETGVLRTTGSRIGMESKSDKPTDQVQIVINIDGNGINQGQVIDTESVQQQDSPSISVEPGSDTDESLDS